MSAKFGFDEKRNGQHDIFRDQQVVPQKDEITAFPRHDQLQRNIQWSWRHHRFFVLAYQGGAP